MSSRFGRILLGVNALATLGFVATAAQGYGISGFSDSAALERHLLGALAATLVFFFAHAWVFIYLVALRREIGRWSSARGISLGSKVKISPSGGRSPILWAAGALFLVLGVFLLGPAVLVSSVPPWLHGAVAYAALVTQIWVLLLEFRALRQSDSDLRQWASDAASASPVPPL